ncbi:MAG TPA: MFS transporter [Syntrophales bacterium]|nr:MFS transporter [Syntrophales bacterium]
MEQKETGKTVRTFAIASFLNDFGSDVIYPIWPLFITSVLGANMAILGLIDGLGEAFVSISKAASGYLSDRMHRRRVFIWSGYLFGAISRIGYAFSTSWLQVIPFKIFDRMGKIRGAPRDAIVADISTDQNRGRHFGLLRAMDNLGAVCGILFCIAFYQSLGYRNLFLLAAIPSAVGALLIFYYIKETKPSDAKLFHGFALRDLNVNFRLFLILSCFFALGSFSYSFLLIYATHLGFTTVFVPVLYLIFTVAAAVFSIPSGRLSDKIGRKALMVLAFVSWGCVCLILILWSNRVVVVLAFVLYGLHKGIMDTVQTTFVAELSPKSYRATGLGVFQMAVGLCALPASLVAGLLWDQVGIFAPLYLSILLTAVSTLLLMFVREE